MYRQKLISVQSGRILLNNYCWGFTIVDIIPRLLYLLNMICSWKLKLKSVLYWNLVVLKLVPCLSIKDIVIDWAVFATLTSYYFITSSKQLLNPSQLLLFCNFVPISSVKIIQVGTSTVGITARLVQYRTVIILMLYKYNSFKWKYG